MFFFRSYVFSFLFLLRFCLPIFGLLSQDLPPDNCSVEGQACEIHGDNIVMTVPEVFSLDYCRQICYSNQQCKYLTYFGNTSFPVSNFCMIFSSCPERNSCTDCLTEEQFCHQTCSDTIVGPIGGNTIDTIADVDKEIDCKQLCSTDSDCQYYTHHSNEDPVFPNICFLLSEIQEPLQPCSHCHTGAADCFSTSLCGFIVQGQSALVDTIMFTEPSANVSLHGVNIGNDPCEFTILGIGGGGPGSSGGGGSGGVLQVPFSLANSSQLLISVGQSGQASSVITDGGQIVMLAPSGGTDTEGINGGNGYSGGGGGGGNGYGGGKGGENGSNGKQGIGNLYWGGGGKGSGVDLSLFNSEKFALTAGPGGDAQDSCGGGGGGVFINGAGPKSTQHQGQGYGGGGGGCGANNRLSGAIVIEKKNQ